MTKAECREALKAGEPITSVPALIEVATEEGRSLDREIYFPDSGNWHDPAAADGCLVCDAGVVMAGVLKVHPKLGVTPLHFGTDTCNALEALNSLRRGYVKEAYDILHLEPPSGVEYRVEAPHSFYSTWRGFERHMDEMDQLAAKLRQLEAGRE